MASIEALKNNKSPGTDGLTDEFYKIFAQELVPFLFENYLESIEFETLPPTLSQGLLTLIPKPKKDILFIDNWCPICLLNCDYKILALILANRLKCVLGSIIDETQSGFIPKIILLIIYLSRLRFVRLCRIGQGGEFYSFFRFL